MIDSNLGKVLIIIGIIFVLVGIGVVLNIKLPLFKLPGDIAIKKGNFSFYFPVVSCIILSVLFTVISIIINHIKK